jgi:hypothetical protein
MFKSRNAEMFVETFLKYYLANGFGAMPKKEIDILLFHLLSESEQIKGKNNYEIANFLKITESRIKTLRLESALKYQPSDHSLVLGKIFKELIAELNKPDFNGNYLSVAFEDPVEKREFEHAVKKCGYHVEYGINKELLKITPLSLLSVIVANIEDGEKKFIRIVKNHITDKAKQDKVLDKALSIRQKINKVGEEISDKSGLFSFIASIGSMLL